MKERKCLYHQFERELEMNLYKDNQKMSDKEKKEIILNAVKIMRAYNEKKNR